MFPGIFRFAPTALVAVLTLGIAAFAFASDEPIDMTPGHSITLRCPTTLTATYAPNEGTLSCAPTAVPSPTATASPSIAPTASPTPSPSPTTAATPTASPSPTPTATPSPTATLTPSSAPTPTPLPDTATCTPVGYGASATGGSTVTNVSTAAALKTAAAAGGKHIVLTTSGTYGVNGWMKVASNTTIESAPGVKAVIKGGLLLKGVSNIIIRNVALRPSDLEGPPDDVDAISLNGLRGTTSRVLIQNVTAIWGPDIGGISMLGDVNDVTVQCSILGEGVRLSRHSEGGPPDGHSMGLSVFQLRTDVDPADRLTFWGNLLTTSDRRMPVIHGARLVDWVNNISYNFGRNPPDGNPRSLNFVGNLVKAGLLSEVPNDVWRSRPHSANPCCYAKSVYIANNLVSGMAYRESLTSGVRASSPFPMSVSPMPAANVQAFILANAGPSVRDAHEQRILDNLVNGTGGYMNGQDYSPHPTWE